MRKAQVLGAAIGAILTFWSHLLMVLVGSGESFAALFLGIPWELLFLLPRLTGSLLGWQFEGIYTSWPLLLWAIFLNAILFGAAATISASLARLFGGWKAKASHE